MPEQGLVEIKLWRFKDVGPVLGLSAWQQERLGTRERLAPWIKRGEVEFVTAYIPSPDLLVVALDKEEAEETDWALRSGLIHQGDVADLDPDACPVCRTQAKLRAALHSKESEVEGKDE